MKNVVLGVVLVVVLGLAAWRFASAKPTKFVPAENVRGYGVCLACKNESEIYRKLRDRPPFKCPACDETAVYAWLICAECQKRFVPELIRQGDGPPQPTPFPVCPSCECNTVMAYDPGSGHGESRGDSRLPEWPQ